MKEEELKIEIKKIMLGWGYNCVLFKTKRPNPQKNESLNWVELYANKEKSPDKPPDSLKGYTSYGFIFICMETGETRRESFLKLIRRVKQLDNRIKFLEKYKNDSEINKDE